MTQSEIVPSPSDCVKKALIEKGFSHLPVFTLDAQTGSPAVFLTNCCIYPISEKTHAATKTKTYYAPTGQAHLLNVTAAVALKLADQGIRTLLHLPAGASERIKNLFLLHPAAHTFTFIEGDLYTFSFIEKLYETFATMAKNEPIAKIDFCLYDSYASGLDKPFLPMFEDSPTTPSELAQKRINFLYNMSMVGYDLLVNKNQDAFRLICPTALAAKRPSSHLFTDTIHKAVSNVLLVTLGFEMSYYAEKPTYIVELAPGIVDSGMYDNRSIREYTAKEAELDGFPMKHDYEDVHVWPMMSIEHLAQASTAYLIATPGNDIHELVSPDVIDLTLAGRTKDELFAHFHNTHESIEHGITTHTKLPEYCYISGATWNGLPRLRTGYTPIMLTPKGQLF